VARRCKELVRLTVVQGQALHWFASSQGAPSGLMYQPSLSGRPRLHATANGKAWLASMSDEAAVRLALHAGLGRSAASGEPAGPREIRTVDALLRELARTRQRGYGLSVEEAESGVKAIAVVVRAHETRHVVGTMSIAGPLLRLGAQRDAELQALLSQAAATLGMVWPRDEAALPRAA
jgi:DNA-binding IclR family transcriptional regulator